MTKQNNTLYLVDASIYIFRAYFSMPDSWQADNGYGTNAVYGFAMFLLQLVERVNPKYLALAFDESLGSCFRNKIYPDYKSSRAFPDDELAFQLCACRSLAEKMGFRAFAHKKYEADDLIATLAEKFSTRNRPLVIISRDKDLGQVLQYENDCLWDYAADEKFYAKDIAKKFGVNPESIPDYLALVGDSIDDIPGVPGVGKKSATALLNRFASLNEILENLDQVAKLKLRGAKTLANNLADYTEQCLMAKQLAMLEYNVPIKLRGKNIALKDLKLNPPAQSRQISALKKYLRSLGFGERTLTRFASVYGW